MLELFNLCNSFIRRTTLFLVIIFLTVNINIPITVRIIIKISIVPFNCWFNLVRKSLKNINLGILLVTLIKLIPLNILHLTIEFNSFVLSF